MAQRFTINVDEENQRMKEASEKQEQSRDAQIATTYRQYDSLSTDLSTLERQIQQLMMHQAFSIWHIGKRLQHIRDERLFEARGVSTFRDYVSEHLPMSRQHAYRYIALVETFERTLVEKHGTVLMPAVPVVKRLDDDGKAKVKTFIHQEGDSLSQNKLRHWLSQMNPPARKEESSSPKPPEKPKIRIRRSSEGLISIDSQLGDSDLLAKLSTLFDIESAEL